MKVRPAALIVNAGRVLTLRYNYNGTDVYMLPGGNMEFGEEMQACLSRELNEELGVATESMDLLFIAEVHQKEIDKLHCIFATVLKQSSKPFLNPEHTSALEIVELPIEKIPEVALYPHIPEQLYKYCLTGKYPENPFLGVIEQKVY